MTITTTNIDSATLATACERAGVQLLVGDLAIDSGDCPCLLFASRASHDAFFAVLRDIDASVEPGLLTGSFAGQAYGRLTILKPEYGEHGGRRVVFLYCPLADVAMPADVTALRITPEGAHPIGWTAAGRARALQDVLAREDKWLSERVQRALDGMRRQAEENDPDGCNNVYADLWQAAGIEFGPSPDPRVRERGVMVLPGLHDDRPAFLDAHPVLKVAYEALEAAARELMDSVGYTTDDLPEGEPSLLEGLCADLGDEDPAGLGFGFDDLLDIIDRAKAILA